MKIIIIAGGEPPAPKMLQKELNSPSLVICADGGANCLFELQILPNYIVGDFDSISLPAWNFFASQGVTFERHPSAKNQTDADLALAKALQLNVTITEIVFLGCLGGTRVDHLLANFGLLNQCLQLKIPATIKDDNNQIALIDSSTTITGKSGEVFSLLAYSEEVTNLSIVGAKYELQGHLLRQGSSLTISNEFLAEKVTITFDAGKLLVVRLGQGN